MKKITKDRKEKGITLIALVVTIVVLLILAGVSLNLVVGNNGLITKAQEAKEKTQQAAVNDQNAMNSIYDELVEYLGESSGGNGQTGKNEKIVEAINRINDVNNTTTLEEILEFLNIDASQVATTNNQKINPAEYEFLIPCVDISSMKTRSTEMRIEPVSDCSILNQDENGEFVVQMNIDAATEMEAQDLLIMELNPENGEVYFIALDSLDSETGKIVVTLPELETITLLENTSVNIISFTIDNISYQAEEGMTWEEWLESDYHLLLEKPMRLTSSETGNVCNSLGKVILYSNNSEVNVSDVIESDYNYLIEE